MKILVFGAMREVEVENDTRFFRVAVGDLKGTGDEVNKGVSGALYQGGSNQFIWVDIIQNGH